MKLALKIKDTKAFVNFFEAFKGIGSHQLLHIRGDSVTSRRIDHIGCIFKRYSVPTSSIFDLTTIDIDKDLFDSFNIYCGLINGKNVIEVLNNFKKTENLSAIFDITRIGTSDNWLTSEITFSSPDVNFKFHCTSTEMFDITDANGKIVNIDNIDSIIERLSNSENSSFSFNINHEQLKKIIDYSKIESSGTFINFDILNASKTGSKPSIVISDSALFQYKIESNDESDIKVAEDLDEKEYREDPMQISKQMQLNMVDSDRNYSVYVWQNKLVFQELSNPMNTIIFAKTIDPSDITNPD
jgi:hypothetical protein